MSTPCKTCAHAVFQRTPSGGINPAFGQCVATVNVIAPAVVQVQASRRAIWPDTNLKCPIYQPKEIK